MTPHKNGYNGCGFDWTPECEAILRDMKMDGHTNPEIAAALSNKFGLPLTPEAVNKKAQQLRLVHLIIKIPGIKIYQHRRLPEGDYMISCDYHAPFYSELWVNRLLAVAKHLGIRRHIIVGDLFDFDWAKAHKSTDGEANPGLDKEAEYSDPLMKALLVHFDENYLICGNHETRPSRNFDNKIQFRHIKEFVGLDSAGKKFLFTEFDKMEVGTKWLLVHPKSYSQVSGSVAVRLAEKYHRHILNAHGHFIALRYDRSGMYMGVDLGGMFDGRKVGYASLVTTTHPFWNNGFAVLRDGYFHHFHAGTDFSQWTEVVI